MNGTYKNFREHLINKAVYIYHECSIEGTSSFRSSQVDAIIDDNNVCMTDKKSGIQIIVPIDLIESLISQT